MWKTLERRYDRNEYKFFPVEVNGIKYEICGEKVKMKYAQW